ncbi:MAG: hypothetical protein HYZ28_27850 [Myxococcales bacterium]|nr:hypothetical protein [Myxococcales bacterium]
MGEVYKVNHVELGKTFALKVMRPELSDDQEFVERFKREAIASNRIGQQNIIDIYDFGRTDEGRFYFVMEYLDGVTLADLLRRQGALLAGTGSPRPGSHRADTPQRCRCSSRRHRTLRPRSGR